MSGTLSIGTSMTRCWFLWVSSTGLLHRSSALSQRASAVADTAQKLPPEQHVQELLNARMEEKFERVRRAWALAKLEKQAHLQKSTEEAVKLVNEKYSKKMADLKGVGLLMQQEAEKMQDQVMSSKASVESLRTETSKQRNLTKSTVADIKAAVAQAEKVSQAEEMRRDAATAEAEATEVNRLVVDTLSVLDDASTRSSRASAIALQAVHQATQNALKLKTIRTIIDMVSKEVTVVPL